MALGADERQMCIRDRMMATGEVMSIGNSFEAAMMKAVSSIELGMDCLLYTSRCV